MFKLKSMQTLLSSSRFGRQKQLTKQEESA